MSQKILWVDFDDEPDEDGKVQALQGSAAMRLDPSDIRAAIARGDDVRPWSEMEARR